MDKSNVVQQNIKMKLGFTTLLFVTLTTIFHIFTFFNSNFNLIYANIALFTVNWLEIYRLVSSLFVTERLEGYLLFIIYFLSIFNLYENTVGSLLLLKSIILNNIIIQCSITLILCLLSLLSPYYYTIHIPSLKYYSVALLVKYVLTSESKYFYLFNEIQVNAHWMVVFLLFTNLLTMKGVLIEILLTGLSLLYGFLMCKYEKFFDFQFMPKDKISQLEDFDAFRVFMIKFESSYIPIVNTENRENTGRNQNYDESPRLNRACIDECDVKIDIQDIELNTDDENLVLDCHIGDK